MVNRIGVAWVAAFCLIIATLIPAAGAAIEEYDAILRNWKEGQELTLQHPLFSLHYVSAGNKTADAIFFKGTSAGESGRVSLAFYTREGDLLQSPPGSLVHPSVDRERREFTVGGIVPPGLRGKHGQVQVTFQGESGKRAAFYFDVIF